jgi:hypothetical protein
MRNIDMKDKVNATRPSYMDITHHTVSNDMWNDTYFLMVREI